MILALETSSSLCAVCLFDEAGGAALADISNNIGRGHAERLMDDVGSALKEAGAAYSDLTAIACGVGPGSFTGIRVAVAAARGFALALKVPVHGVTSLQSIALQAAPHSGSRPIIVVEDAGRDELRVQLFDGQAKPSGAPETLTAAALAHSLPGGPLFACGSGAHLLFHADGVEISPVPIVAAAASIARASLDPAMRVAPRPLYLRAPDAKPQAGFAIARESL